MNFSGLANVRFEPILVRTVRGSMERKLDSRWALIRENETDLIFVDENEIIYPKRINADKGNLVIFLVFKMMLDFYWLSLLIGQYENSGFKINLIIQLLRHSNL